MKYETGAQMAYIAETNRSILSAFTRGRGQVHFAFAGDKKFNRRKCRVIEFEIC